MKKIRNLLSILLIFSLVLSLGVTSAFADDPEGNNPPTSTTGAAVVEKKYEGNQGFLTEAKGRSFTFKKYLIIGAGDANVPDVTFSFTIAAGEPISTDTSDNSVFQVDAGVMTGIVQPTDVTFSSTDTTYTSVQTDHIDVARTAADRKTGLTAATGVQFETAKGEKYAVKESTIDFSGVTFVEPGIYRYIITETASTANDAAGIMHDNDVTRVLDVYVTDSADGSDGYQLEISGYVLHKGAGSPGAWIDNPNVTIDNITPGNMGSYDVTNTGDALRDKTDGFTNEYKSVDLAVKKEVYGNQASHDKFFAVTVKITNAAPNASYAVSLNDDADANTHDGYALATSGTNNATIAANEGKTNPTTVTANASGVIEQTFYLQHGNWVVVRGLPQNAVYTVTENAEDYRPTPAAVTNYKNAVIGTMSEKDLISDADGSTAVEADGLVSTSFLNTRTGVVPTGIITVIGPAVAVILLGLGGLGFVLAGKRRREEGAE